MHYGPSLPSLVLSEVIRFCLKEGPCLVLIFRSKGELGKRHWCGIFFFQLWFVHFLFPTSLQKKNLYVTIFLVWLWRFCITECQNVFLDVAACQLTLSIMNEFPCLARIHFYEKFWKKETGDKHSIVWKYGMSQKSHTFHFFLDFG